MLQNDHAVHIKTIFCDLDGCIFKHFGDAASILTKPCELLPGVKNAFKQWCYGGYTVILITGRPESMRTLTIEHLRSSGISYHRLMMDLPRGPRVVINDIKPNTTTNTAACVNLVRNEGMKNVDI